MNESETIALTRSGDVVWELRDGAEDSGGGIAWVSRSARNSLASGFGRLRIGRTPPKTLDYDEVIYVLKGAFGVICNGAEVVAEAGGVLSINRGSTVAYFGSDAEFFFVVTAA
ncbi:hypothetical protein [Cupriavidus sp. PET2-C1]